MVASTNDDVTVVIANYNYGAYLEEAIASLESQEGGPPRIVVVDDGSTDPATLDVLDGLAGRADVVRQANQGAAAARNAGLAQVQTAFAMNLDADDQLAPGSLLQLKAALAEHPSAGYAYGYIE